MAAGRDNIVIEKGITFNKTWIWQDSSGAGMDISAYEARMQIREVLESTTILVSLTSSPAAGITLEPAAETGRIDVRIGADVTETLDFNTGVYDLELYDPADITEVIGLVEGAVSLRGKVTR